LNNFEFQVAGKYQRRLEKYHDSVEGSFGDSDAESDTSETESSSATQASDDSEVMEDYRSNDEMVSDDDDF